MKKSFLFFFLFLTPFCFAHTLKDRLVNAKCGDFCILQQKKISTILRIADIQKNKLTIEEISAPTADIKNLDWQKWIAGNATKCTSWVLFEIDLDKNEIIEIFSFTRMAWLESNKKDNFLIQMLESSLEHVSDNDRKKIGSPPLIDETDRRAFWNPPMKINGKKVKSPSYDVFQSIWPEDSSELSGKKIQLYFDDKKEFFFPFWIDLIGEHLSLSVKVIDAGHGLKSPKKNVPYRPIEFFLKPKQSKKGLSFYLVCPKYYDAFEIFALNYLDESKKFIKLDYERKTIQNDKVEIFISDETLKKQLESDTYYTWYIKPLNSKTTLEWNKPLFIK